MFRTASKGTKMTTVRPSDLADAFGVEMARHERNQGPALLLDWWRSGELSVDDLAAVLPAAWVTPEWPEPVLGTAQWMDFFRLVGFLTDDPDLTVPTEPLTVYRGTTQARVRHMSWTTDPTVAQWFADRWREALRPSATVFTVLAPPEAVLAVFNFQRTGLHADQRGETEVVVDPFLLPRTTRWSG